MSATSYTKRAVRKIAAESAAESLVADMPIGYGDDFPLIPDDADPADYKEPRSFDRIFKIHHPAHGRTSESWSVNFSTSWGAEFMFVEKFERNWLYYEIAPVVTDWLAEHATDVLVSDIDRGDWGEGIPIVTVDFAKEKEADAFVERFGVRVNVLAYSAQGMSKRYGRE